MCSWFFASGVLMEKEDNDIRFINKSRRKDDFLIISNRGFIRDTRLSLKAKGLLTLMLTNKEDWIIHLNEIINHSTDGEAALKTGIKELIECKYMRKIRERDKKGQFKSTLYYIYDEPFDDSKIPLFIKTQDCVTPQGDFPLVDNPSVGNPLVEKPPVENHRLTNINNNNINNKKTKLTNSNQPVSESVFINIIKSLFASEYLFDNHFESDVLRRLENAGIETSLLEDYLNYVFERTKLANPIKSFEGLFRKLALSNSISRDFKLNLQNKKTEESDSSNPYEKEYECPICHTVFKEFDYYCPKCALSLDAIKSNDQLEITIKTKLYQMSEEERSKYDADYQTFVKQKGRGFLTMNEQIQFYKDYGILN